ncbi:hypothetical protein CFP56_006890 [Quercus suber]|uniref:Uncharacterized protein n=1 Tax=Quercus suber TaxID=58331 RepID=A0AAW0M5T4_QUESU
MSPTTSILSIAVSPPASASSSSPLHFSILCFSSSFPLFCSLILAHIKIIPVHFSLSVTLTPCLSLLVSHFSSEALYSLKLTLSPPPARLILNVAATEAQHHRPTNRPKPPIGLRPTLPIHLRPTSLLPIHFRWVSWWWKRWWCQQRQDNARHWSSVLINATLDPVSCIARPTITLLANAIILLII